MPTLIAQTGDFPVTTRRLPPEFETRPRQPSDIPALGRVYFGAYPMGVAETTLDDATKDIAATFDGRYGELWPEASPVVETAGKLVCAVLTVRRAPWDDIPDCPFIIEVFTAGEHRRRGLARAALTHVAAVISAAGENTMALRVGTDNVAALSLYRSLGFHAWGG